MSPYFQNLPCLFRWPQNCYHNYFSEAGHVSDSVDPLRSYTFRIQTLHRALQQHTVIV